MYEQSQRQYVPFFAIKSQNMFLTNNKYLSGSIFCRHPARDSLIKPKRLTTAPSEISIRRGFLL
ncbi:hypothetical protein BMW22_05135 [Rhizobium leguminosarum]|uniref:Uncharacterized protein n=1 Tax=Rhizobium leguminosarum TaxID=384 RepID=A0A1L3Z624_RHILE|nr:hypothetical protein BMW22_05135 [Rhizobium leguminosarum]